MAIFTLKSTTNKVVYPPLKNPKYKVLENLNSTSCAKEGEQCNCDGKVYYGRWMWIKVSSNKQRFKVNKSSDVINCDWETFGLTRRYKNMKCYCQDKHELMYANLGLGNASFHFTLTGESYINYANGT